MWRTGTNTATAENGCASQHTDASRRVDVDRSRCFHRGDAGRLPFVYYAPAVLTRRAINVVSLPYDVRPGTLLSRRPPPAIVVSVRASRRDSTHKPSRRAAANRRRLLAATRTRPPARAYPCAAIRARCRRPGAGETSRRTAATTVRPDRRRARSGAR